jgi:hypothetical protein
MNLYNQTDKYLHFLSQVITKVNRTYVPLEEDDSHTNLSFDSLSNRIVGRWFDSENGKYILGLNVSNFEFELINDSLITVDSISTVGFDINQVEEKVSLVLQTLGLDTDGFHAPMHFEIPDYGFSGQEIKMPDTKGLEQWIKYRSMANEAGFKFCGFIQNEAEVRIWPHHFDTGLYTEVNEKLGLGFGLAMEDSMAKAPYFYLSGYSLKESFTYKDLPQIGMGEWIVTGNWKGAILRLTDISAYSNARSFEIVGEYMVEVARWYLKN